MNNVSLNSSHNINFGMRFTFKGPQARSYARALHGGMQSQGKPSMLIYDELHDGAIHVATEFDAIQAKMSKNLVDFFKNAINIITK